MRFIEKILLKCFALICLFVAEHLNIMQGEYVDSIKWYKDGAEFYRIVPNTPIERDRVVIFDRPGLNLDRQKSGVSSSTEIVLMVG